MGKKIHPVNLELYEKVVDVLTVGSQRPDFTNIAREIENNRGLIFDAYRKRRAKGYWDGMYEELVSFAKKKAKRQRGISGKIERNIPRRSYV